MNVTAFLFALFLAVAITFTVADDTFDVRRHLSTVTSYSVSKAINSPTSSPNSVPAGCKPIHLNLVARHGTRAPTKKRIKEMDRLEIRLNELLDDVKQESKKTSLEKVPAWLSGWQSPWKGRQKGGELIKKGEDELYHLGVRVREMFPELFDEDYHPDIYNIRATQVPRASASAVAFGLGLFSGKGELGPGKHRAFSVICESRASDIHLRFFESCATYKEVRRNQEPAVEKLKEPILDEITSSLIARYQLNFTKQDTASLWFLCKEEASLLDITDRACGLFTPSEVSLLEWTDDLEAFILKGYGQAINHRMGVPLLQDVIHSMEQAISDTENHASGGFEKARLRFAHAETVVPFTCLLGLFLDESEFEQVQREQPLCHPPKPPQARNWRGSTVAPFAGNNMLVLYQCPSNSTSGAASSGGYSNEYYVQVLHNEVPVALLGCDNKELCKFEIFKEKIVNPHLKHDFHSVCNSNLELPVHNAEMTKPCSVM